MKNSIKTVFNIFKYSAALFTIAFWVFMIIDDYIFIEKYWDARWQEYLATWSIYFLVYLIGFSLYFWVIALTIILIYHKIIKRVKPGELPPTGTL